MSSLNFPKDKVLNKGGAFFPAANPLLHSVPLTTQSLVSVALVPSWCSICSSSSGDMADCSHIYATSVPYTSALDLAHGPNI